MQYSAVEWSRVSYWETEAAGAPAAHNVGRLASLHGTALHYTTLYCTALYYTVLDCTEVHITTKHIVY